MKSEFINHLKNTISFVIKKFQNRGQVQIFKKKYKNLYTENSKLNVVISQNGECNIEF